MTHEGASSEAVPPVIAFDRDGEASVFETAEAAEAEIEPNDVYDDEMRVFDSRGLRLRLEVNGWDVRLEVAEAVPSGAGELEDLLRRLLDRIGDAASPESTLEELIAAVSEAGYLIRWRSLPRWRWPRRR